MFNFFCKKNQRDQLLDILSSKDWVSTDAIIRHWIKDPVTIKYRLTLEWFVINVRNDKPHGMTKPWTHYKTYYKLVSRIPECHKKVEHRDYLRKFSNEEIISELWARNMLDGKLIDGEVVHFINE